MARELGDKVSFYTSLSEFPLLDHFPNQHLQQLVIFDDQVLESDQSRIKDCFIRGRKIGAGLSFIYISQSYYQIPKIVRLQFGYLILLKAGSMKDLRMILGITV